MSKITTAQREAAYYNLLSTYRQQVIDMDYTTYSTRIAGLRSTYNTMELIKDCLVHDRTITGYGYSELSVMADQICRLIDSKLAEIEF